MLTKDTNLNEIVKPFAKDEASQEKILDMMNKLRPEEDGVYSTFPAASNAIQEIKEAFWEAGIEPDDDTICTLCETIDNVYLKGIAHGISLMLHEEATEGK